MPLRPVERDQQPSAPAQQPEQLRREELIVDPGIGQESIEPPQGTADLNAEPDGHLSRYRQRSRLSPLDQGRNDPGQGLLLGLAKGA